MKAQPAEIRLSLRLPDEEATARLAEDVAAVLTAGDLVALSGGLGAGKTTFARALLRSLAGNPALEVQSPTFPLRIDHVLPRLKVVHADLYRLGGESELGEIGLDEAVEEAALVVEWPEKLPADLTQDRLDVALEIEGDGRSVVVTGRGSWPARLARTARIRAFLDRSGWAGAARVPIVGDASVRAYERIARPSPPLRGRDGEGGRTPPQPSSFPPPYPPPHGGREETAILMNAAARSEGPPIYDGRSYDAVAHRALDVRPFIAIDRALQEAGARAPKIHASDIESGLLLLEDFGNEGMVDSAGAPILVRYEAAIDLLVHLHGHRWSAEQPLADGGSYAVPPYDRDALLVEISLFPDYFAPDHFPPDRRAEFLAAWSAVLDTFDASAPTLVLRDFHSPNILWQESESGIDRVGVLDFQDALIGHPAYDVASLAQDARVPLAEADEAKLKARYVAGRRAHDPAFDAASFDAAYAILGLQRATKVLGGFARLARNDGKVGYLRHGPRLKALVRRNLVHPVLSVLRVWYEPHL